MRVHPRLSPFSSGRILLCLSATMLALAACATPNTSMEPDASLSGGVPIDPSTDGLLDRGASALNSGDADEAIAALAELAARNPRDANVQTQLALAWQMKGERDPEAIVLASAGYDLALRAKGDRFWAAALAGRAASDRSLYQDAAGFYAQAVLARPQDGRPLLAFANASYMAGDAGPALLAAEQAASRATSPELRKDALELAALAAAASNDADKAAGFVSDLRADDPPRAVDTERRVAELIATTALDDPSAEPETGAPPEPAVADQVSVDVAIVLSQTSKREKVGVNLLDGLSMNYSLGRSTTKTRSFGGGTESDANQSVLTEAIGIPQLTYNLNIFNRGGQGYSVVARPSLTAFLSEPSEFFIGRSLKVAVGGVNTSSLEQIDIGIELKVTPVEITADSTRLRIEATRSFLTADPAGSFAEALTTFRQRVAATAEVKFGETLILSGLSEHVDDATFSKTPGAGDVPLLRTLFKERTLDTRRDAALVLVTPSRPERVTGRAFFRPDAVERLGELWVDVIDPASNAEFVADQFAGSRSFSRMAKSDASRPWPDLSSDRAEAVRDLSVQ